MTDSYRWLLKSALTALFLLIVVVVAEGLDVQVAQGAPTADVPPKWTVGLPKKGCADGSTNCHVSSPALVDLNGDQRLDVVVATNNGHVVAIRHDGSVLWQVDTAPYFGMAAGKEEIFSSPATADIDRDGQLEIVVGVGTIYHGVCTQGGVIVLKLDGQVESGWPRRTYDTNNDGCSETVYSSPALGDLTGDGYLEIVVGSFDKRIYAWDHRGNLLPGFPPDSFLRQRFPTWTDLVGRIADTIWSSPTLADLDGDGHLDILIGTDEGYFDASWGGNAGDWRCPYAPPPGGLDGYCGGSLYALDRHGSILPGFPRYFYEIVQSTPAVADLNNDGRPEIYIGSGSYYYQFSPDRPTYAFRVYGLDHQGKDLPGWEGGKRLGGVVNASPVIGDIAGDGQFEVVVGSWDQKIYAWGANGQAVSGFPMRPVDRFSNGYPYSSSFVLADYDGDPKMEIIVNQASTVAVIDGDGRQLTNHPGAAGLPDFRTLGANYNMPAAGDVDGDGKLELVAHNSVLYVWDLDNASNEADWPMFKQNAARTSAQVVPLLAGTPTSLRTMVGLRESGAIELPLTVFNAGDGTPLAWQATASSNAVTILQQSGTADPSATFTVRINRAALSLGENDLGDITVTATAGGETVAGSPLTIPVTVWAAENVYRGYLPSLSR